MICALCSRPMVTDTMPGPGQVRRSKAKDRDSFCIECVNPHVGRVHLPRYCECPTHWRDPTLPEQCQRCLRRIHPSLDTELVRP